MKNFDNMILLKSLLLLLISYKYNVRFLEKRSLKIIHNKIIIHYSLQIL